jgi:hypothetical protein
MRPLVVVGPCAAGKTTLVEGLVALGVDARAVAQEHSAIPNLFCRNVPDDAVLVYLTADYRVLHGRRPHSSGRPQYAAERPRLESARAAADLLLHTDGVGIEEVRARVLTWLEELSTRKPG